MLVSPLRRAIGLLLSCPACFTITIFKLLSQFRNLRSADVVVVHTYGGFGHTITGPDVVRRLYHGKRIVYVMLVQNRRHNPEVQHIWPDVDVVTLPLCLFVTNPGQLYEAAATWLVRGVCNWLHTGVLLGRPHDDEQRDLYAQVPRAAGLEKKDKPANMVKGHDFSIHYYHLLRATRHVQSPEYPARWHAAVCRRLNKVRSDWLSDDCKVATLYLRQKDNDLRSGSQLTDYLPSVDCLVRRGYRVFLVGDVKIPRELTRNNYVAGYRDAGVSRNVFRMYAALRADLCIAEPGGGIYLPNIRNIPCLVMNSFPFGFGLPNSWIHPKRLIDEAGQLVDWQRLFSEFALSYEFPSGIRVENNSSHDIQAAVAGFVDAVDSGQWESTLSAPPNQSEWSMLLHAQSPICPTWFRAYENGQIHHSSAA